jgi:glucosamine--fructose-6-phosphate aminotransferase (isomerizing)
MSAMRETMWCQPADLRALLADAGAVEAAAHRLRGRRIVVVGTGTSWHAANHAVWLLREARVDAWPLQAMDAAAYGLPVREDDALLLLSHRNTKRYSTEVLERERAAGRTCVVVGGRGSPGVDVETVEPERSAAFTASHLGALMRVAQLARALGARMPGLEDVPDAVEAALEEEGRSVEPPERLLELTGAGPNQWTAAEGALKVRETSRMATEGLSVEQLFHGPSVALGERDALVALDGGGPAADRLAAVADAAEASGVRVYRVVERTLPEPLTIFPLTAAVQRTALELAEQLGTDPDAFGYDVPGRRETWAKLTL